MCGARTKSPVSHSGRRNPDTLGGPTSDPRRSPDDQAALALMWQAALGNFDALLLAGLAILAVGLKALGVAILGTHASGKGVGWLSVVIGALVVAAGVVLLTDPGSPIAAVSVLSLIVFHLVLGWKVYSLSKVP